MDNDDNEFYAALEQEINPKDETTEEKSVDNEKEVKEVADKEAESTDDKASEGETADDKEKSDDESEDGEKADGEKDNAPTFATKQDVMDAMREYSQQTTERVSNVNAARDEIVKVLHPEGIDKNIYDTDGNVIKTAQDIVDRNLLNPQTNEPFSYEEAASWLMASQRQMNENVEELMHYAEGVAETNISLSESNHRVMTQWGDVLGAMPNVAQQLAESYIKTLEFDPTGSYVVKAPVDPVAFYDMALAPYIELANTMAELQTLKDGEAQKEAESERDERSSLPQRGSSKVKSNTGDPFLDALVDELES